MRIVNIGTTDIALQQFRDTVMRTQCYEYADSALFEWVKSPQRPYIVGCYIGTAPVGWAAYHPNNLKMFTPDTVRFLSTLPNKSVAESGSFAIYVMPEYRRRGYAIEMAKNLRCRIEVDVQYTRKLQQYCPGLRFALRCAPRIHKFVNKYFWCDGVADLDNHGVMVSQAAYC